MLNYDLNNSDEVEVNRINVVAFKPKNRSLSRCKNTILINEKTNKIYQHKKILNFFKPNLLYFYKYTTLFSHLFCCYFQIKSNNKYINTLYLKLTQPINKELLIRWYNEYKMIKKILFTAEEYKLISFLSNFFKEFPNSVYKI